MVIHNIQKDFYLEYMSKNGKEILGVDLQELQTMGAEYHARYFNPEDTVYYITKSLEIVKENDMGSIHSFFQQVKPKGEIEWQWYCSSIRILLRDDAGLPLLVISNSVPIDPDFELTRRMSKVLDEKLFYKRNLAKYELLTPRELAVLTMIAQGKTNKDIGTELFISINTVETHKKNIKEKLEARSPSELMGYAKSGQS